MKKFLIITLILMLSLSALSVNAANLEIDGVTVKSDMLFTDDTAYVPLSSVASALNKRISWDEKTQNVFLNGIELFPEKSNGIGIYVNGEKYTPTDTTLLPKVKDGEVYLPAHLAAEALGLKATWYNETATLTLSAPVLPLRPTVIDENEVYTIVNRGTGKVLSSTGNSLTSEEFNKTDSQKFKIVKTEFEGYYHIKAVSTLYNLDVNSHGTTPGVNIITWEQGTGDNQKFQIKDTSDGAIICARSCHLPIEPKGTSIIQNTPLDASLNQKWEFVPFDEYVKPEVKKAEVLKINYTPTAEEKEKSSLYRTFSISDKYLSDSNGLCALSDAVSDKQKWTMIEYSEGIWVIENLSTKKSVDVNARSLEKGASVITWQTSRDTNQRWILEQNGDGTYYIKSAHSSLYLTLTNEGKLIQEEKNTSLSQRWTINGVN